ncbi:MAG: hypothetical protein K2P87_16090 [Lachnospiraceae bacterium]|nr:hypothetical protein [Lachnospiraceae bacterium]
MKVVYRILFLLVVFCASLYYFGSNMQERVFSANRKTTQMEEATLPVVTVLTEGGEINLMHGYCSNLDAMLFRESITPIAPGENVEILITENAYNIKKVNYEIYDTMLGTKLEEGSVISLEKETVEEAAGTVEKKSAKLRLKGEYAAGGEYVVKLTLISNESKRIYYYTRFKLYANSHLAEKLEFVDMFHNSLLDKGESGNVKKYLETKRNADETDFSHADLHNSLHFLSYGELEPRVIHEEKPVITEYTQDTASVVLGTWMELDTTTGIEKYYVREYFRFRYTQSRVYLYNYERSMEAVFDVENTSLVKNEFKLGITPDTDLKVLANYDNTRIAFVRRGTLYVYTVDDNVLTTAFTFEQKKSDRTRDTYDKHDIRLLSVDDTGSVDFLVYGYMNRGEYEGRVGMILYTYHPADQTVEERAYFPVNTTYEILKETMGRFAYCNYQEIFYFHIYDTIYAYNLITGSLSVIAENVTEDTLVYSDALHMLAWQPADEAGRTNVVHVMNLDLGTLSEIRTGADEILGLLGMIDDNLILGKSARENAVFGEDGTLVAAYEKVEIVDFDGNQLKNYEKSGYYVVNAEVEDNVVRLERVAQNSSGGRVYQVAEPDYILNQVSGKSKTIQLTKRVTELMKTEYYISLPDNVKIGEIPGTQGTKNVVITDNTTVRVNMPEDFGDYYLTYAYGSIVQLTREPGEAILMADEATGSVIGSNGAVIWSRGVKAASAELRDIVPVSAGSSGNSLMACVKMLLNYCNVEADTAQYRVEDGLLVDWLSQYLKSHIMKLNGVTLDEALYYVYLQNPVIAVNEKGDAILVIGYDKTGINVIRPETGRKARLSLREAESFLGGRDYYFIAVY